jgi:hypothetical protein
MKMRKKMKHKHYDLIVAWANGGQLQYRSTYDDVWIDIANASWDQDGQYRIKPEPKQKELIQQQAQEIEQLKEDISEHQQEILQLRSDLENCICQGGHSQAYLKAKGKL